MALRLAGWAAGLSAGAGVGWRLAGEGARPAEAEAGVPPENIIFVNVVCVKEGIEAMNKAYPAVKIVTGGIDPILNEKKYIVPGLGDFGDRFFGTDGN